MTTPQGDRPEAGREGRRAHDPAPGGPERDPHDPMAALKAAQAAAGAPVPGCVAGLYERVWDAVVGSVPEGVDERWPVATDSTDAMVLSGPENASLAITPRMDAHGALTGAAWRGRGADGASILGHGGPDAAVATAAAWAAGLDRVPAITGPELAARRAATGASQADLARLMGVGQGVVSQWETGARAPRDPGAVAAAVEALEALADDLYQRALADGTATGRLPVWDTIGAWHAARPDEAGRGASPAMARVAAARAWHALRAQGKVVRITAGGGA
ncbi:helix-turn-helix domain-containing protein [Actinomyces sp. zg296]|uniref:helix-turn-helix domain-containing protein n=1 Tax=Actinomyces sp. zg296 TaxID=2609289 RepID=UPI00135BD2A2|nr:helix-turn-helix domain-containing protein [Actinomyces sp. zg296]